MVRPFTVRRTCYSKHETCLRDCREPPVNLPRTDAHHARLDAVAKFTSNVTKQCTLPLGGEASRRYPEWGMAGFAEPVVLLIAEGRPWLLPYLLSNIGGIVRASSKLLQSPCTTWQSVPGGAMRSALGVSGTIPDWSGCDARKSRHDTLHSLSSHALETPISGSA